MCLAVLWSEQAYLGLLAVSSLVLDHARACEAVGLSAGRRFFALVSRGGSSPCTLLFARKLRGRLLSSPFPAVGVGGFFEAARPCLCLSHRHRFFALSLRSGSSPSLLFVGVFGHLLPCVFSFSAMGVSGLVEVCSPFGPLFSPACLAMLGLFWCFQSCWYFLLGAASSRSARAAVLRLATYSLLSSSDGSASLASYQPPAVSRIMVVFVQLLAFLLGASSSRSVSATVLRPAPFFQLILADYYCPESPFGLLHP